MIIQMLFILLLIYMSIKSLIFLRTYFKLMQTGAKTEGQIVSFEFSSFLLAKYILIPKIKFVTGNEEIIIRKPIHSFFIEVNNCILGKNCVVFYDQPNPGKFVVKNNAEILANLAIIIITVIAITWFLFKLF